MNHNELISCYREFNTWAKPLAHVIKSQYFNDVIDSLNISYNLNEEENRYSKIYPEKKDLFKAFYDCPYEELKVVIIGSDPYCNGKATGVAFANENEDKISPELDELYRAIYGREYDINPNVDTSLENLSSQGILFLNPILTVEENKPLSHWGIWNTFTIQLLEMISNNKKHIIYSMFGTIALSFKPFINSDSNILLECEHPSEAVRKLEPWKCTHFKAMNYILDRYNKQIVW